MICLIFFCTLRHRQHYAYHTIGQGKEQAAAQTRVLENWSHRTFTSVLVMYPTVAKELRVTSWRRMHQ